MVILCFGPAQQDCSVLIIFINSYVYIYISIISIHFQPIIHCFRTSSLILFHPCSSFFIKSFHACSIFPFPSSFHPFFILFSFLHQCLSNFIHCHPLFIHILSVFFFPFPSIFNASSLVFINFCSCYAFLHLESSNFPLPPSCICPHCPGTLIVLQDTSAVSKWSFYVSVRHSKTVV